MLSKEDIQQIRELIVPVYERLDHIESKMATKDNIFATNETIADLKGYINLNNKVLHTIFKVELHEQFNHFWKQIKKIFEESITRFKEKDQSHDKQLENHEKRISDLELSHKN